MIAADTSALVSLATADTLYLFLEEFEVHTTETVRRELENTAGYDDSHGEAARNVLDNQQFLTVHEVESPGIGSPRIDAGEASCIALIRDFDVDFSITDDLRALPELQTVVDTRVAISPIVLKALVEREVLDREDAETRLRLLAESRDWLGAPIYRRAQQLLEGD